ncbi:FAD:protein FMN transferase [Candidatus Electrothrix sp.]|uniref:FAD:protein FMN transferase n=1 Tax=Candidatus Electrothrix sp. TaxID=2170559 RepID=UPI004056C7D2
MKNTISPQKGMTRRSFFHIAAFAGLAASTRYLPFFSASPDLVAVRKSFFLMGTQLNLTLYSQDQDQAQAAVATTIARMQELEGKLSRHQQKSEIGILNRTGLLTQPSKDLQAVLELANSVNKKTAGAFDITILPLLSLYQDQGEQLLSQPERIRSLIRSMGHQGLHCSSHQIRLDNKSSEHAGITLDGIGKGYIVDQGVASLQNFGFHQVLVEAGGDLLVKGSKPQGIPWRIGIRKPRSEMPGSLLTVNGDNMAVATSGDYFQPFSPDLRYHHIINPKTGFSSPELASCTITAPNAALADALATGCMVLGKEDSMDMLAGMPACEGLFIDKNMNIYKTGGFAG